MSSNYRFNATARPPAGPRVNRGVDRMKNVRWLRRDEYWAAQQQLYALKAPVIPYHAEIDIELSRLRAASPFAPVATLEDEDFPGPAERWYGEVGGRMFTLDVPIGAGWGLLRFEPLAEVRRSIIEALVSELGAQERC
jgi:hypothetical protein